MSSPRLGSLSLDAIGARDLSRRDLLRGAAAGGLAAGLGGIVRFSPVAAQDATPDAVSLPATHRLSVGQIEVAILQDGLFPGQVGLFAVNAGSCAGGGRAASGRPRLPERAAPARRDGWPAGSPRHGHRHPGAGAGHLAVEISSDEQTLLHIVDAAHIPEIHLVHPDWFMAADNWPAWSVTTRKALFDRAADENLLVSTYHFPFPGVGRVAKDDVGWVWTDKA